MPIYIYKHPTKEEYEEVVQSMNDPHTYSKDGVEWERVFFAPNMAISASDDPFSANNYVEKTANMKGTVGDLLDYSAELSENPQNLPKLNKTKRNSTKLSKTSQILQNLPLVKVLFLTALGVLLNGLPRKLSR